MTVKETLHRLVDELPDEMAVELEHYAGYLRSVAEQRDWDQFSLSLLDSRYGHEEVEYDISDVKPVHEAA